MTQATVDSKQSLKRRLFKVVLGVALVVCLAVVCVWLARKPIANWAMSRFCEDMHLTCTAEFSEISIHHVGISNLIVEGDHFVPVTADKIELNVSWTGLLSPAVEAVTVQRPVIRAQLQDNKLMFGGLETLLSGEGSGGGEIPAITVTGGKAYLLTDAGDVSADFQARGALPNDGTASIIIQPAQLQSPRGELLWERGVIELTARGGVMNGTADLALSSAKIDDLRIEKAAISARLQRQSVSGGAISLEWGGTIQSGHFPDGHIENANSHGEAVFEQVPEISMSGASEVLSSLVFSIIADATAYGQYAAGQVSIEGDLSQSKARLAGPVSVVLNAVNTPYGRVTDAIATGDITRGEAGYLTYQGGLSLSGASVDDAVARNALKHISLPGSLSGHGASLRATFSKGLSQFDLTTELSADLRKGALVLMSDRAAEFEASSGLSLSIEPPPEGRWLMWDSGDFAFAGNFILEGGGAPRVTGAIQDVSRKQGGLHAAGDHFTIAPWRAEGRTVSGRLNDFNFTYHNTNIDLNGAGHLTLSGPFSGTNLDTTRLEGEIQAARIDGRWRMRTQTGECLAFSSNGISFGALDIAPVAANLCAPNGAFIEAGRQRPGGEIRLGEMRVPFTTQSGGGTLTLPEARIDWAMQNGLSMNVRANELNLPLTIGERLLIIDSATPNVGVHAGNGPLRVTAEMGATVFGGTMIPANISADRFSFNGVSGTDGISGTLAADSVVIADTRDDPLYAPLIMDVKAPLKDGQLTFEAPIRLKTGGVTLADLSIDLDVVTLKGTAGLQSRQLTFKPGGLQPNILSRRLTGVFTNAVGTMSMQADVAIAGGGLTGTGLFEAKDFGFQTTSIGRVDGVNGIVRFTDLIGLSSAPAQTVTIGSINPGIPLENGTLVFQLENGKRIGIDTLQFPFAGGELSMLPGGWTMGAEEQRLQFRASKIELEALAEVLKIPDLEISGTVSGDFPVEISGASTRIQRAVLKADEEGGRLAYTGAATEGAGQANENVELAFKALKDFRFSVLELGLDGDVADRMTLTLKLLGRNPNVVGGGEFDFNIAIDSELMKLINNSQYLARQTSISKIVGDQKKAREDAQAAQENE